MKLELKNPGPWIVGPERLGRFTQHSIHRTDRVGTDDLKTGRDASLAASKEKSSRPYGVKFRDDDALGLRIDLLDAA